MSEDLSDPDHCSLCRRRAGLPVPDVFADDPKPTERKPTELELLRSEVTRLASALAEGENARNLAQGELAFANRARDGYKAQVADLTRDLSDVKRERDKYLSVLAVANKNAERRGTERDRLRALLGEACALAKSFDVHGSQPGERDRLIAIEKEAADV